MSLPITLVLYAAGILIGYGICMLVEAFISCEKNVQVQSSTERKGNDDKVY